MTQENSQKGSARKTYIVLRDQCCDTNVLNAHTLTIKVMIQKMVYMRNWSRCSVTCVPQKNPVYI